MRFESLKTILEYQPKYQIFDATRVKNLPNTGKKFLSDI